jgi:flagellar FliL protein
MAGAAASATADGEDDAAPGGGRKKLFMLVGLVLLLAAVGAGLWFSGLLPHLLGHAKPPEPVAEAKPPPPTFIDVPELIANLDAGPRRSSYVKLRVKLELDKPADTAAATAAMPRLQDMFQTYLREMRPEELRGGAGTYRLREELLARARLAVPDGHVTDVLFTEMVVQ